MSLSSGRGGASRTSKCPHVVNIELRTDSSTVLPASQRRRCLYCNHRGANLWRCLQRGCDSMGCGEKFGDHSQQHAIHASHPLMLNTATNRAWCVICECEVFLYCNSPPVPRKVITGPLGDSGAAAAAGDMEYDAAVGTEAAADHLSFAPRSSGAHPPCGLAGLKNLGNTCYLNSAVQALSHCVPLSQYFLTCPAYVKEERLSISKLYCSLLSEIWSVKRPSYIIPTALVQTFKIVNPAFRGYNQQDTQEFLRCFMDRVHEELKHPVHPVTAAWLQRRSLEQEAALGLRPPADGSNSMAAADARSPSETHLSDEDMDSGVSEVGGSVGSRACLNCQSRNSSGRQRLCDSCSRSLSPQQRDSLLARVRQRPHTAARSHSEQHGEEDEARAASSTGSDSGYLSSSANSTLLQQQFTANFGGRRRTVSSGGSGSPHASGVSLCSLSRKSAAGSDGRRRSVPPQSSIISEVFNGKLVSCVQCLYCQRASRIRETFQDLSLPIPNKDDVYLIHNQTAVLAAANASRVVNAAVSDPGSQGWLSWVYEWVKSMFWGPQITLNDCLSAFFSADELKGDNMYSCEQCQKLRNGLKMSRVLELPEVLSIHLKRFRHESLLSSKVSTPVSFPLEGLSLAPFMVDANTPAVYDLVSVICHHGYAASGGHYTGYGLSPINGQWYEYDDQIVTAVPDTQVQKAEAYVLFYRKRSDPSMVEHRRKVAALSKMSCPTSMASRKRNSSGSRTLDLDESSDLMQFFVSRQWLNRFYNFSDPGPVTNGDFLCPHNRVPPELVELKHELAEPVSQSVWEYFQQHFGGGPTANHLHACATCKNALEEIESKRSREKEVFAKLNSEFRSLQCPSESYLIDMEWYKSWEAFIRGKPDAPGPIDNSNIHINNGATITAPGREVGQISAETWNFLFSIYGGGPVIVHRNDEAAPPAPEDDAIEDQL